MVINLTESEYNAIMEFKSDIAQAYTNRLATDKLSGDHKVGKQLKLAGKKFT